MLKAVELSILSRLTPVRELLRVDGVMVRGLPDEATKMLQEDSGDVVVFIKGGDIKQVKIEINILLPSRVKSSRGCFPVIEKVWGLLHQFIPVDAAGALTNMTWQLMTQDTRWLAKLDYTAAISPFIFENYDDTLPGIDQIVMIPLYPTAPTFQVSSSTLPAFI